tara:strand:+ start:353 stop:3079 length:2727 start_codon:yes stop_codon:yes gene_type:complete
MYLGVTQLENFNYKKTILAVLIGAYASGGFAQELANKEKNETEVISVTGLKGSNLRALNNKRYSDSIVDGISSEDLGKFPDQNVAESLQRITGISIDRNGGEGQFITVRGFGPEFNSVLYNGRVLATENSGREFSFDVLAAEAISGADAYKSATSELISGGIGATINLTTAKPMDVKGTRAAFSTKATHDTLSQATFPQASGVYSISNDTFGALVSLNYVEREYRVDTASTNGWLIDDISYVPNQTGSGDFSNVRMPRGIDFKTDEGTRERLGGTIVIQAKPTDNIEMTLDILYSKFTVKSSVMTSANWMHNWTDGIEYATVDENNTLLAYQYDDTRNFAADFVQQSYNRPTESKQIGFNLNWVASDDLLVTFDTAFSNAVNDSGGTGKFVITGSPEANPHYSFTPGDDYGSLVFDRSVDASTLRSHGTTLNGSDVSDQISQTSLDAEYILDTEYTDKVTVGVYTSNRTKGGNNYSSFNGGVFSGYGFDVPDDIFQAADQSDFLDGNVPSTWFTFDPYEYVDFLWSDAHIQEFIIDAEHNLADTIQLRKDNGGAYPRLQQDSIHAVNEKVYEAFVKLDIRAEFGDISMSGNVGLRYSKTDLVSTGYTSFLTDITQNPNDPTGLILQYSDSTQITETNDYSYLLPSLNLKFDVTDEQVVRFSSSKSIARPTLGRLSPGLGGYNGRLNASTASGGNPQLNPYESLNLDLSWSWYYDEASHLGAAVFSKDVDNFIAQVTKPEIVLENNEFGEFLVTRSHNAESAKISGLELSLLHTFESGYGLQANYTFVESDDDYNAITNPDAFALEGLSNSYNLIAFYDANDIQLRIAYNWRDEFLQSALGNQSQPEMVEAYGQLDLSASYDITEKVTIFAEGTNVTNENTRSFSIYQERYLDYTDTGARFSIGVRANF